MSAPLKVLRVIARLNVGGPARHVTILDKGLRARGFETLLAFGQIGPGEASLEQLVDAAAIPARRIPELGRRVSPLSDVRALVTLARLVFAYRPDVVHTHTAKAGTLGRLAAALYNATRGRNRRCLVVHTYHGHVLHGYFGALASLVVRVIERAMGLVTDCVLTLSPRQQTDIGDRYHIVNPARIHVVPLGLELQPLLELPPRTKSHADPVVFGFVGRFVPIKNLPLLIDAFARVHAERPEARLVLVGDGEGRASLEADVAARGIQQAVAFAGWRQDLAAVYREVDVMVLTSLNEGTPVAIIEAMAAGLAAIATEVGGVPDVVEHGVNGVLIPSESAAALAGAMLALARDPLERRRLGLAGREMVRARFGAERLVADVAWLYDTELRAKRAAG